MKKVIFFVAVLVLLFIFVGCDDMLSNIIPSRLEDSLLTESFHTTRIGQLVMV